jgi:hypothetical protein
MNVTRKRAILVSLALILVSGAILTPSLQATPLPAASTSTLVLTENSSSELKAVLNGTALSVPVGLPNNWVITLPTGYTTITQRTIWADPEGTSKTNIVDLNIGEVDVASEATFFGFPNPNGSTVTYPNALNTPNGVTDLAISFIDNGDVAAAVPEPSTLSYMILTALVSAIGFRRRLRTVLR